MTKSTEGEWTEPVTTKTSAPQASEPANEREIQKSKWPIPNKKNGLESEKSVIIFQYSHKNKHLYLYVIYLYKNIFQKKISWTKFNFFNPKITNDLLEWSKMNKLKYFGIYFGIIDF